VTEDFKKMKNKKVNPIKDCMLHQGALGVVGATSKETLDEIFNQFQNEDTFHVNGRVTEELINEIKESNKSIFVFRKYNFFAGDVKLLRKIAQEFGIKVVIGTSLRKENNHRLSKRSDFEAAFMDLEASLLIGITEAGVAINKNRFDYTGEITKEEIKDIILA